MPPTAACCCWQLVGPPQLLLPLLPYQPPLLWSYAAGALGLPQAAPTAATAGAEAAAAAAAAAGSVAGPTAGRLPKARSASCISAPHSSTRAPHTSSPCSGCGTQAAAARGPGGTNSSTRSCSRKCRQHSRADAPLGLIAAAAAATVADVPWSGMLRCVLLPAPCRSACTLPCCCCCCCCNDIAWSCSCRGCSSEPRHKTSTGPSTSSMCIFCAHAAAAASTPAVLALLLAASTPAVATSQHRHSSDACLSSLCPHQPLHNTSTTTCPPSSRSTTASSLGVAASRPASRPDPYPVS